MSTVTGKTGRPAPPARRYKLSDKFFNSAIKDAVVDSLFYEKVVEEKEDVRLKPGFKTACWAFLPPHQITIGTDLFEKRGVKLELSDELQKKYIANHYHHERGHALETERDMPKILAALKSIAAPFSIFNLFEDARMEACYRRNSDYRFDWLDMETLDFGPRPESLLFALIQAEGEVERVVQGLADWKPEPPAPTADETFSVFAALFAPDPEVTRERLTALLPRVVYYYEEALAARDCLALMPLLNAWLDEFGRQPEMPKGGANGGMSDLEHSALLMTDEDYRENFEANTVAVEGLSTPNSKPGEGNSGKASADDNHKAEAKQGKVLSDLSTKVDMARAQKLATRFLKFFSAKSRVVSSLTPQRKISARHFAIGRSPYRKVEVESRGVKNVFLEVDCSGSMGGPPMQEGKVLVAALSLMARQGAITGHVALSAVHSGKPCWETFKLPLAQEVIEKIQGNAGAEGLEYTLKGNLDLVKKADYVFVYTDADICDKPIQKSFFHGLGIFTWGLYAGGDTSVLDDLMRYFDKAVMRHSAEELVDAMLVQLK